MRVIILLLLLLLSLALVSCYFCLFVLVWLFVYFFCTRLRRMVKRGGGKKGVRVCTNMYVMYVHNYSGKKVGRRRKWKLFTWLDLA